MIGFFKKSDYYHPLIIWLILLLWYLAFADKFFQSPRITFDNFISEQAFWFLNQTPKEANDITIVAVDEASRRHLNLKWPWKRSVTAELIKDIASFSPKIIGIDIVFSGESSETEDKALISAFKSHPKIFLGYVFGENSQEKPNEDFVDAVSSIGFVNKPMKGGVVDATRLFYAQGDKKAALSLEMEIFLNYLGLDNAEIRVNEQGIFLKDSLLIPSPQGKLPLNYLVHPSHFRIISASSILKKDVSPSDFKDKIVLVGVTDPLIHDEYLTPLGAWPGVTIIANSLVMLLSKRNLVSASMGANLTFMFLLGLLIIFINGRSKFLWNTLFSLLILSLTCLSFVYLRARDIHFSYLPIIFSGTTAYIIPNLYRYLNLMVLSNRLKNLAITDPLTGLYSFRFFLLQLDEKLKSNDAMIFFAFKIADYKKLILNLDFEQIKLLTRLFAEHLQFHVKSHFKSSILSRISNDTMGIVIEGSTRETVVSFLKNFLEKTEVMDWELRKEQIKIKVNACLISRFKAENCGSEDVIYQMESLFEQIKEDDILVEELKEVGGAEKKARYLNIMDFIAYDWEERNRDLEEGLKEILETNRRLNQLNWGTLEALARAIDAKSKWTAGHSERVTKLAIGIGRALGLTQEELDNLHRAGLLHDIGKIGIPAEVIDKPGGLTDEEDKIIREHPIIGNRILEPIEAYREILPMIRQHHEWFNGEGYPDGIAGEDITIGARILAVADIYDALSSKRPYRPAMDSNQALHIVKENAGSHLDPVVVDGLIKFLEKDGASKAKPVSNQDGGKPNLPAYKTAADGG